MKARQTGFTLVEIAIVLVIIGLLLGGILPGLLCVAMLMLMTGWLAMRRNYPRAERWPTAREFWRDFKPAAPAITAPLILIGALAYFVAPIDVVPDFILGLGGLPVLGFGR